MSAVTGSVSMETACVPTPIELELEHFGEGEEQGVVTELCWRASLGWEEQGR